MGLLQLARIIEKMNKKLGEDLGIKIIDVKYIKSEQAIAVRKVKK